MSHRKRRVRAPLLRFLVVVIGGVSSAGLLASGASAAVPTPESLTTCSGALSADTTGAANGEPNLLDYSFSCDGDISAYTVILDRQAGGEGNIDDYNPAPGVLDSDGVTPNLTDVITCEGLTPSDGINCNLGAGGVLSAGNVAQGSIDPVQQYCAFLPTGAVPGTPAVPQAIVQLIVTDASGAEDGPFDLDLQTACPKVAAVVPVPKPKPKVKAKAKAKTKAKPKPKPKSKSIRAGSARD